MSQFKTAMEIMEERFAKDSLIAVATTDGTQLHNRMLDAFYDDGAFYITTHEKSNKMLQIKQHSNVAIAAVDWFSGHGIAENIGWVLDPKNADIRLKLRDAFSQWYDFANDEKDINCCILKIQLTDGVLIKDHHALRYKLDFKSQTALVSEHFSEFK